MAILALWALLLGGCGAEEGGTASAPTAMPTATEEPVEPGTLTPTDVKDPWPFTVKRVVLRCDGAEGLGAVTVTADGKTYGVNGTAQAQFPDVEPIWKDDPDVPGTKVNISEVLDMGLAMCDG